MDLSKMTDQELLQLRDQMTQPQAPAQPPPQAPTDLTKLSDQELLAMRDRATATPVWDAAKKYGGLAATGLGEDLLAVTDPYNYGSALLQGTQASTPHQQAIEALTGKWPQPEKGNYLEEYARDVGRMSPLVLTGNPLRPFTAALGTETGRATTRGTPYETAATAGGGVLGALAPELWPALGPFVGAAVGASHADQLKKLFRFF